MKRYAEELRVLEQQIFFRAGKHFDIFSAQQREAVLEQLDKQDPIFDLLTEYMRYASLNADCA